MSDHASAEAVTRLAIDCFAAAGVVSSPTLRGILTEGDTMLVSLARERDALRAEVARLRDVELEAADLRAQLAAVDADATAARLAEARAALAALRRAGDITAPRARVVVVPRASQTGHGWLAYSPERPDIGHHFAPTAEEAMALAQAALAQKDGADDHGR